MTQNKVSFDVQKEKGVFFDAHNEFIDRNQALSSTTVPILDNGTILEMPQIFDQLFERNTTKKVIKLNNLFKIYLVLMEDKYTLTKL